MTDNLDLPLRIVEAAEDCMPLVRMLSLIAIGIPSRRDFGTSIDIVKAKLATE